MSSSFKRQRRRLRRLFRRLEVAISSEALDFASAASPLLIPSGRVTPVNTIRTLFNQTRWRRSPSCSTIGRCSGTQCSRWNNSAGAYNSNITPFWRSGQEIYRPGNSSYRRGYQLRCRRSGPADGFRCPRASGRSALLHRSVTLSRARMVFRSGLFPNERLLL